MSLAEKRGFLRKRIRCNSNSIVEEIIKEDSKKRKAQPDYPIHCPRDSMMSSNTSTKPRNFEGFINWGFLLLCMGGFRLFLENLNRYGVRVNPLMWITTSYRLLTFGEKFYILFLAGYINVPIILALIIERMAAKGIFGNGKLGSRTFACLHVCNILQVFIVPIVTIRYCASGGPISSNEILPIYIIHITYIVLAMKLVSYVHVNYWARKIPTNDDEKYKITPLNFKNDELTLKRIEKLSVHYKTLFWLTSSMLNECSDPSPKDSNSGKNQFNSTEDAMHMTEEEQFQLLASKMIKMKGCKKRRRRMSLNEKEMEAFNQNDIQPNSPNTKDLAVKKIASYEKKLVKYPENLLVSDIYYFMVAPTLCYELNFPRSGRVRASFLFKRALEVVIGINLLMALAHQWVIPSVVNSLIPFSEMNLSLALERLLKLAIPNHLIWLTCFYLIFHSYMNTLAEILLFADRLFYQDWWNSENVGIFWRKWNNPVHQWFVRHVYKPILRIKGSTKMIASTVVFLLSAILHEYAVSIPLQMFKAYAFLGMALQVPLMEISSFAQRHMGNKAGNIIVWMSLIIGQPLALLMYYHDFVVEHYGTTEIQNFANLSEF